MRDIRLQLPFFVCLPCLLLWLGYDNSGVYLFYEAGGLRFAGFL